MLLDVSWDQNNVIDGQRYSEYAFKVLGHIRVPQTKASSAPPTTAYTPSPTSEYVKGLLSLKLKKKTFRPLKDLTFLNVYFRMINSLRKKYVASFKEFREWYTMSFNSEQRNRDAPLLRSHPHSN